MSGLYIYFVYYIGDTWETDFQPARKEASREEIMAAGIEGILLIPLKSLSHILLLFHSFLQLLELEYCPLCCDYPASTSSCQILTWT